MMNVYRIYISLLYCDGFEVLHAIMLRMELLIRIYAIAWSNAKPCGISIT